MCILTSPAAIIHDIFNLRELRNTTIEGSNITKQDQKLGTRFSGQNRIQLPQLSPETLIARMEKEWDFIALGISIYDSENTPKVVTRGLDHIISHPLIKWSIKVLHFSGYARELRPSIRAIIKSPGRTQRSCAVSKIRIHFSSSSNFIVPLLNDEVLCLIEAYRV